MKKAKRESITWKTWRAVIFLACLFGLIIIGYVSIWDTEYSHRWKVGMTLLQTLLIVFIYSWFENEIAKQKKIEKRDSERKSFQERLEEKAKEKGIKLPK